MLIQVILFNNRNKYFVLFLICNVIPHTFVKNIAKQNTWTTDKENNAEQIETKQD